MQRIIRTIAVFVLFGIAFTTSFGVTTAHEHREIADGQYVINIGFINEPAFVNQQNGLYLRVDLTSPQQSAGDETPVAEGDGDDHGDVIEVIGLTETLEAEVIFGDQSMPLSLSPGENPGEYVSVFFPTAVGDYTFRITGEIEGTAVDETFTSSPEGFDSVQAIEDFQFPKP